jgi:hypothetical protein
MESSPFIHFPYTEETAEGVVHSGIVGPCIDGTYTVIAVCPDSRRKPSYSSGHQSYSDAVGSAKIAYSWYDKDEPQLKAA